MRFLDLDGLKRFLLKLLTKIAAAFDDIEARVTNIEGDYLSKSKGGTVNSKTTFVKDIDARADTYLKDTYIGEWTVDANNHSVPKTDIDPETNKNKAASSLRVNGTTELAGDIITHGQNVEFGDVNVENGLNVNGSAHLPETFVSGSLDMQSNNINHVQSITVAGTVRGSTYKAPKLDATAVGGTRIGKPNEPYEHIYVNNLLLCNINESLDDVEILADRLEVMNDDETSQYFTALNVYNVKYLLLDNTLIKYADLDGNAASADRLNTNAGGIDRPVYFKDGKPVALNYTIAKSVPSDAKFTDTTYSGFKTGTVSAAGKAGLVPAPPAKTNTDATAKFLSSTGQWSDTLQRIDTQELSINGDWVINSGGWSDDTNLLATGSKPGLMSPDDKRKLDSIYEKLAAL